MKICRLLMGVKLKKRNNPNFSMEEDLKFFYVATTAENFSIVLGLYDRYTFKTSTDSKIIIVFKEL